MLFKEKYPPADRGTIIVWGLLSALPFGGIFWQVLHHVVGFRRLGFDVWYIEDSDRIIPDTDDWMPTTDYSKAAKTLSDMMNYVGLKDRWVFRVPGESETCLGGADFKGLMALYQSAVAAFNLCGAQEELPCHQDIRCRVLLETDPCFPQIGIALGNKKTTEAYNQYQYVFTYGANIGSADCLLPARDIEWIPTRPPVITDWWNPGNEPPKINRFTTISNWDTKDEGIDWQGSRYFWNKNFTRFIDLPGKSKIPLELALGRIPEQDKNKIANKGWQIVPAVNFTSLHDYNEYICNSLGEFTVSKDSYVRLRSGWFSDRSVCYLAAGRPVITEETGFSKQVPAGEGLFAFSTEEEIVSAIDNIHSDYKKHSRRAKEIAEEYFKAETVLGTIAEKIGI